MSAGGVTVETVIIIPSVVINGCIVGGTVVTEVRQSDSSQV